ncbi:MAG: DUF4202 domain-containing protein [Hyphomicrobiaceae bacterium]|nr:DUF4202 domain-containing protein [Hyphomicrobiaceae bacterium]
MTTETSSFQATIAAIDEANAGDPRRIKVAGVERPFEVVYAERMSERLIAMYPGASENLRIAARAQHLRRWDIPRANFPDGRIGYNAWRRTCREHHGKLVSIIMTRHGYTGRDIDRVVMLIKKEQLKKDRESQALENVVDVVFMEHYFEEFLEKYRAYDDDKIIDILGKTLRKMSPKGHRAVLALELPARTRDLVGKAIEREGEALVRPEEASLDE